MASRLDRPSVTVLLSTLHSPDLGRWLHAQGVRQVVLSLVASLLGFGRHGGLGSLLGLAMVMGFGGAFISLFMS